MNTTPLAERMRPKNFDEYIGQQKILGPASGLRKAIQTGKIPSMILWGPPGVGKTTLAQIIADTVKRPFYSLSAINSGVKDIRDILAKIKDGGMFNSHNGNAVLFIDEIHRFSKSQQDSLLGAVEKGVVTLIGATTENPSFEVISALLSRCQVYTLQAHTAEELLMLVKRAIQKDEELSQKNIELKETGALLRLSGGDARKLLNIVEMLVHQHSGNSDSNGSEAIVVTDELVMNVVQSNLAMYDKDGEQHYDIISAFIKSIRGSDPNAAVYWLARMIEGGEDPKFIARRLVISAAEDIGLANPNALLIANAAFDAIHKIGWPEGRIVLAEAVIYLATSAKGNAAYKAIDQALAAVRASGSLSVPIHLRNAPTALMKDLGYGENYKYAHDGAGNFIEQEYLPETLKGTSFYEAGSSEREREIGEIIKKHWGNKYQK